MRTRDGSVSVLWGEPESMAWVSQYADANMVKTESFEGYSTIPAKSMALMNNL